MARATELDGERSTPGAGAEHGDRIVRNVVASQALRDEWRRVATPPRVASVDGALRGGLGSLLLQATREELVEVDGRKHEVREATLRHEVRNGHARVREQHVRADGADRTALVVGGQSAHRE